MGVAHQVFEQIELTSRKFDTPAGALDSARYQVHMEVSHVQAQGTLHAPPAQQCLNACQKLRHGKRLYQVVIGARGEAADTVVYAVLRGEDDHQAFLIQVAPGSENLQPIATRQADVQHDQIETVGAPTKEAVFAGARQLSRVALARERFEERRAGLLVILDDQDPEGQVSRY